MKTIKIAMTCVLLLASLPGISQPVPSTPANQRAFSGGPMTIGSANDHEIQKLNMELTKVRAEFALELAKVKKDIAAMTNELAFQQSAYSKHTHEYMKSSNDFFPAKAKCGWGGKECDPVIWYDVYRPRYETSLVSAPK